MPWDVPWVETLWELTEPELLTKKPIASNPNHLHKKILTPLAKIRKISSKVKKKV